MNNELERLREVLADYEASDYQDIPAVADAMQGIRDRIEELTVPARPYVPAGRPYERVAVALACDARAFLIERRRVVDTEVGSRRTEVQRALGAQRIRCERDEGKR